MHGSGWDTLKFRATFILILAMQAIECVDESKPLHKVFDIINTTYTYSNCVVCRLLLLVNNLTKICNKIS